MRHAAPLPLADRIEVDRALEGAFAPLRQRRANVSPLRVHAAVRWGRGAPPQALPWSGAVARLSELSLAVGMTAMFFIGAFGAAQPGTHHIPPGAGAGIDEAADPSLYPVPRVTAALEDERYIRWLRLDRFVPLQDWLDPSVVHVGLVRSATPLIPPDPAPLDQPF